MIFIKISSCPPLYLASIPMTWHTLSWHAPVDNDDCTLITEHLHF